MKVQLTQLLLMAIVALTPVALVSGDETKNDGKVSRVTLHRSQALVTRKIEIEFIIRVKSTLFSISLIHLCILF